MNFYFVENYISKLTKKDIENFALKENITLNKEELNIIYYYIKNNYKNIIYNKPEYTLKDIKEKYNTDIYLKVKKVYLKYKEKIDNFTKKR